MIEPLQARGPLEREIARAIEDLLRHEGYELVLLEYVPRGHVLRLYIDRDPEGVTPGVTIDDCVQVSRVVGDVLDAEGWSDRIEGSYHLEVSSPGLDRPLTRRVDFERFAGREVKLRLNRPIAGRRKVRGRLGGLDGDALVVHVDGARTLVPFDAVERARLVPVW